MLTSEEMKPSIGIVIGKFIDEGACGGIDGESGGIDDKSLLRRCDG
jgi:hypothetical protein